MRCITGITGQDGSYLTELLLEKAMMFMASFRRASTFNTDRIDHIYQDHTSRTAATALLWRSFNLGTTHQSHLQHSA